MTKVLNKAYFLLQTLSDEPVRLTQESLDRLGIKSMGSDSFILRPDSLLIDVFAQERVSGYVLSFATTALIGVIKSSFLELLMPADEALSYMQLSRISFREGEEVKDTGFLLFKPMNIIYTRAKHTSMFIPASGRSPVAYVPDGKEYITHVPSFQIPIYGTQMGGQLIIREDVIAPILAMKKFPKLHIAKLKIQAPIDGFEFQDSISLR